MAKKNECAVDIADLHEEIEELKAKNKALYDDCLDLQRQNELLVAESIEAEDRYNEERKQRVEAVIVRNSLESRIKYLCTGIEVTQKQIAFEKKKRLASLPKLVIVGVVAMVTLVIPYTLQMMAVIGPQLAFTIEAVLLMVIAWCYALIWDRSRK